MGKTVRAIVRFAQFVVITIAAVYIGFTVAGQAFDTIENARNLIPLSVTYWGTFLLVILLTGFVVVYRRDPESVSDSLDVFSSLPGFPLTIAAVIIGVIISLWVPVISGWLKKPDIVRRQLGEARAELPKHNEKAKVNILFSTMADGDDTKYGFSPILSDSLRRELLGDPELSFMAIDQSVTNIEEAVEISELYRADLVIGGRYFVNEAQSRIALSIYTQELIAQAGGSWVRPAILERTLVKKASTRRMSEFELQDEISLRMNRFVLYFIGTVFSRHSEYEKAISYFSRALVTPGQFEEAQIYCERAIAHFEGGIIEKAMEDFDRSVSLRPDVATYREMRAIALMKSNRYEAALADVQEVLESNENSPRALSIRAEIRLFSDDPAAAVQDLLKATQLEPDNSKSRYNLGIALARLGKKLDAVSQLSLLIDSPDADNELKLNARIERSNYLEDLGRRTEALADIEFVLENAKDDKRRIIGLINRGRIYSFTGKFNEAISDYNQLLQLQTPWNAQILTQRAHVYEMLGYTEIALSDYSRAIEIVRHDPPDALYLPERPLVTYLSLRSEIYLELGQLREFIVDLDELIRLDSSNSDWYKYRCAAYVSWAHESFFEDTAKAVFDRAARDCEYALELQPNEFENKYSLSGVLIELGEYHRASQLLQPINENPTFEYLAHFRLGQLRFLQGRFDEAIVHFREAAQKSPDSQFSRLAMDDADAAFRKLLLAIPRKSNLSPFHYCPLQELGV